MEDITQLEAEWTLRIFSNLFWLCKRHWLEIDQSSIYSGQATKWKVAVVRLSTCACEYDLQSVAYRKFVQTIFNGLQSNMKVSSTRFIYIQHCTRVSFGCTATKMLIMMATTPHFSRIDAWGISYEIIDNRKR
jgi:hypothetical protein